MKFRSLLPCAARLLLLAAAFFLASGAQADHGGRKSLTNSVKELRAAKVRSVKPLKPDHLGEIIEFQIALKMRDFPKLLARVSAGDKITRREMQEKYLPLPDDYEAVLQWVRSQGLRVTQTGEQHLAVFAAGTVAQLQEALQVKFAKVELREGTFTSAISDPSIPAHLEAAVLGINGLQPHIHPLKMSSQPQALTSTAPPYLVKEILKVYGADGLSLTGSGEKIAILIDTFPSNSDLTAFWANNNIPQTTANIERVAVVTGTMPLPSGEETLDVEWASGIASAAKIRVYATQDLSFVNLDKGLHQIIADLPNQPQLHALSISLGLGESFVSTSQMQTDAQYLATIASSGVSIFVSSGDQGSNEGGVLQPSYFATDPSVTAVGGTTVNVLPSSGAVRSETGWSGSGGGVSSFFSRPSWQTGAGVPAGSKRLIPDVAAAADPNTGAYVYLGGAKQIGGTSWSAPLWAGFSALINQSLVQNGQPRLGLLNRKLYPLLGSANFRDVVAGNNGAYNATAGYDLVTGLGTPQVASLVQTLAGSVNAAPVITDFSPVVGVSGGSVTINGANFSRVSAVKFNGLDAASFSVASAAQITCVVPAGATSGPITVTTPQGTATSATGFTVIPPITNDAFTAAQAISGVSGTISGGNVGATKEAGEPNHAGNAGGSSVWYVWTPPVSGNYTIDTFGSSFDTLLGIYTGTSVNALTTVASNDDSGTSTTSSVSFTVSSTTTYYLAVDGYNGATGAVTLNWTQISNAPAISTFTPGTGGAGTTVTMTGLNFSGTTEVTFNGLAAPFTIDSNTQISAAVPAGATTGPIAIFSPAGAVTSTANFIVVAGSSNDNFANAEPIVGASGTVTGDNTSATKEPGEPDHAGNVGGRSIWYSWVSPSDGPYTFDTTGSSFDTLLAVYTGTSVSGLTLIASNDDVANAVTSRVTFNAIGGTTYFIAVDGYNGDSGSVVLNWTKQLLAPVITGFTPGSGGVGSPVTITGANLIGATQVSFNGASATFQVTSAAQIVTVVPVGASTGPVSVLTPLGSAPSAANFVVNSAPANDAFASAQPIAGASATVTGTNVGATKEAGEPNHAGNAGGASVWWEWTAPASGTVAVTTGGSNFDTVLAVYTGSSVGALTLVAANDDDGVNVTSRVTINTVAGTTYQIAVDGYNGATGDITLSILSQGTAFTLYATGFEGSDGFSPGLPLGGQGGWITANSGGNGIVTNVISSGQQAYIGYSSPRRGTPGLFAWHPLDYAPTASNPVVTFSVTMQIVDSTNGSYDDFQWAAVNRRGDVLFAIDFNNNTLGISYMLDDGTNVPTATTFTNGTTHRLVVTMDFSRNVWSATWDGDSKFIGSAPITKRGVPLDLGDVDAVWLPQNPGFPGNNFMVFDDYSAVANPQPLPQVRFQPLGQTATVGDAVRFSVVATGAAPLNYSWRLNGRPIPGATTSDLAVDNVQLANAGNYTVVVANSFGTTTSKAALLTVRAAGLAVTGPLAGGSIAGDAGASTTVQGWVAGNVGIGSVLVSLNGGPPMAATLTPGAASSNRESWQASIIPENGANVISVTAINNQGNASALKTMVFRYVAVRPALAGYYAGLATPTAASTNPARQVGFGKVTVAKTGVFTGMLTLGGSPVTVAISATFGNGGDARFWVNGAASSTVEIKRKGLPSLLLALNIEVAAPLAQQITGTLTENGTVVSTFTLDRPSANVPATVLDPLSENGAYTGIFQAIAPPNAGPAGSEYPQGDGWAWLKVKASGAVTIAGNLGDGQPFSFASSLSKDNVLPIYLKPYAQTGTVSGPVAFRDIVSQSDADGIGLRWFKPASPRDSAYQAGWPNGIHVDFLGSKFVTPAKPTRRNPAPIYIFGTDNILGLQGAPTPTGVTLMLADGGTPGYSKAATVDGRNKVVIAADALNVKATLAASNGRMAGSFKHPVNNRTVPFSGVVYQKNHTASGYFLFYPPRLSGQPAPGALSGSVGIAP